MTGNKIVLEEDGTEIEENELLNYFKSSTFILLKENETWLPPNQTPKEIIAENELTSSNPPDISNESPNISDDMTIESSSTQILNEILQDSDFRELLVIPYQNNENLRPNENSQSNENLQAEKSIPSNENLQVDKSLQSNENLESDEGESAVLPSGVQDQPRHGKC